MEMRDRMLERREREDVGEIALAITAAGVDEAAKARHERLLFGGCHYHRPGRSIRRMVKRNNVNAPSSIE